MGEDAIRVGRLVSSVSGIGRAGRTRALQMAAVAPGTSLRDLSDRQRSVLIDMLHNDLVRARRSSCRPHLRPSYAHGAAIRALRERWPDIPEPDRVVAVVLDAMESGRRAA